MDIKQSVEVVSQVVAMAQKGGLLTLQDAVIVSQALEILNNAVQTPVEGPAPEVAEELPAKAKK